MTLAPKKSCNLAHLIETRQALLGISDQNLCAATGLEHCVSLTLMKSGCMRVPLPLIPAFALALNLYASELFTVALKEYSPELLAVMESIFSQQLLTPRGNGVSGPLQTHSQQLTVEPQTFVSPKGVTV